MDSQLLLLKTHQHTLDAPSKKADQWNRDFSHDGGCLSYVLGPILFSFASWVISRSVNSGMSSDTEGYAKGPTTEALWLTKLKKIGT